MKTKSKEKKDNTKNFLSDIKYRRDDYVYASARLRFFEKKLLTDNTINSIFEAGDTEELRKILEEKGFPIENSVEESVKKDLVEKYDLAKSIIPDQEFLEVLLMIRDYQNLKVLVKSLLASRESSDELLLDDDNILSPSNYSAEKVYADLSKKLLEKENPLFHTIIEKSLEIFKNTRDSGQVDAFIDKKYFSLLAEYDLALNNDFLHRYVNFRANSTNLLMLLRLRAMKADLALLEDLYVAGGDIALKEMKALCKAGPEEFTDFYKDTDCQELSAYAGQYGRGNTALEFGRKADDILMEIIRSSKKVLYGPEVIMALLLASELQAKNINIALTCVRNGVPKELAKEMMRETFFTKK